MDDCTFCRIARGDAPAHVVHADEACRGLLTRARSGGPCADIITREHALYFEDLSPEAASRVP